MKKEKPVGQRVRLGGVKIQEGSQGEIKFDHDTDDSCQKKPSTELTYSMLGAEKSAA